MESDEEYLTPPVRDDTLLEIMEGESWVPPSCARSPTPPPFTGDKNPYTEQVYAKYMLVICLEYQNFPEPEYAKFSQNMLNNGITISQPSILWD